MSASKLITAAEFGVRVANQNFDFLNSTINWIILDSTYTPDMINHRLASDVNANEITDTDYSRQTQATKSITEDADGRAVYDGGNVSWGTSVSISGRYAMAIQDTGNDSTSPIMGYYDLNLVSIRNSNYQWTASGSGTNEYYLEASGGGDPSIASPSTVYADKDGLTNGTIGSLNSGEWAYGDNDALGFTTVYVRLPDNTDPDSKSTDYVEIPGSGNVSSVNSEFTVQHDANGIVAISRSI